MEMHSEVLLIMPDNIHRRLIANTLKSHRYSVTEVSSFFRAIPMATKGSYDVTFLDENICFSNDEDIDTSLRTLSTCAPIFMIHSNLSKNLLLRFLVSGVYGFLEKPLQLDKVLSCIEESVNAPASVKRRYYVERHAYNSFFQSFRLPQQLLH